MIVRLIKSLVNFIIALFIFILILGIVWWLFIDKCSELTQIHSLEEKKVLLLGKVTQLYKNSREPGWNAYLLKDGTSSHGIWIVSNRGAPNKNSYCYVCGILHHKVIVKSERRKKEFKPCIVEENRFSTF